MENNLTKAESFSTLDSDQLLQIHGPTSHRDPENRDKQFFIDLF